MKASKPMTDNSRTVWMLWAKEVSEKVWPDRIRSWSGRAIRDDDDVAAVMPFPMTGLALYVVYFYPSTQEPPKAMRVQDFEDIDSWTCARHYGESFSSVAVWASNESDAIELAQTALDESETWRAQRSDAR